MQILVLWLDSSLLVLLPVRNVTLVHQWIHNGLKERYHHDYQHRIEYLKTQDHNPHIVVMDSIRHQSTKYTAW